MKLIRRFCFVFLSMPFCAFCQTACPIGTPAGSATCGPSPSRTGAGGYINAPPPRPSGEWIKTWGAIAQAPNGDTGVSSGQLSKNDAETDAINKCGHWGASNCSIKFTYRNQCVVSVDPVSGGPGGSIVSAGSVPAAVELATKNCEKWSEKGCKVSFSQCSDPIFKEY
ncbi:DUF4189 domain-containing protein [Variovorax ginsengisoli]|uniref:DUF4189 domain-containing protein n=1 Tax=Variovorax ginsengisoli TaxID=363844 RepID=UPI0027D887D0|nr:DUF4189 domain-containing protein [Variovorax ginsengisoli]